VPLNFDEFDFVRTLVQKHAALVLDNDKMYLAEARLAALARREGFESSGHLVAALRVDPGLQLRQKVIEAMVTNETSFFRDKFPFEALRRLVLPELCQRRATERVLNIWCGAASTGQEPYSVAMLLHEHFTAHPGWTTRILATDLSTEVLERARRGCYSQLEINRGLPAPLLVKYFQRKGAEWHLKDEVRNFVDFRPLNLVEAWPRMPRIDIVLLRNVLIYFDVPTKKQILSKVRQILRADGYLFLGGAETTINLDDQFERVDFDRAGGYRLRPY
jgi:chemotaxis protein methyltransferase CheR